jgi:hypothetical protein
MSAPRPGKIASEDTGDGVRVIVAHGRLDGSVERLRGRLAEALAAARPIVLDLTGITSADAEVVAAIADAQRDASDRGIAFVAALDAAAAYELPGSVALAGLLDAVPREPTREKAIAAVGRA